MMEAVTKIFKESKEGQQQKSGRGGLEGEDSDEEEVGDGEFDELEPEPRRQGRPVVIRRPGDLEWQPELVCACVCVFVCVCVCVCVCVYVCVRTYARTPVWPCMYLMDITAPAKRSRTPIASGQAPTPGRR